MSFCAVQLAELLRGELAGCGSAAAQSLGQTIASSQLQHVTGPAVVWDQGRVGEMPPRQDGEQQSLGVVTDREVEFPWASWQIRVEDVAAALQTYAAWKRGQFSGEVIAVAGPIGKSTASRIIRHLAELRFADSSIVAQGERSTPWDALLVLANLAQESLAIVECDSPQQLKAANPTMAVLTAHPTAAGFGRECVVPDETLGALSDGTHLILPGNIRISDENHSAVSQTTSYGREADCDIALRNVACRDGQLSFEIQQTRFVAPVWGRFHMPAVGAAIAVAHRWQVPFLEIVTKLKKFSSHGEGCSVFHHANMTFIKDTRHDSRDSQRAAFELLREVSAQTVSESTGRKVVVFESRKGLTDHDRQLSRQFGDQVISVGGADLLFAIGNNSQHVVQAALDAGMRDAVANTFPENNNVTSERDRTAAESIRPIVERLQSLLQPGDTVLFKCGLQGRLESVMAALQTENNTTMPLSSLDVGVGELSASTV